ncbi:MAG: glycosyltransferase family 4 protein [Verrucomicrobiota bacterium]
MRIVHLTPGTGNFHCGSCLRDNHLAKALRRLGHDVTMVPLYLPLVTDDEPASPELPVFAGGINLFLKQKLPWFRHAPAWLQRALNSPSMLLAAAKRASMTSARQLGEMTEESFRGVTGRQAEEWSRLIDWIAQGPRPDVLSLSNGLLNGLAVAAQRDLGLPVVCSLQGEDSFLDTLPEPWRSRSWDLFRENSSSVARYVATSEYYAGIMRDRLQLPAGRVTRVYNGMDFAAYEPQSSAPNPPVIGYLARQCHGKGLHTLVDAFILLAPHHPTARLAIAGTTTEADDSYIATQQRKIEAAGLGSRVSWNRNLSFADKIRHLQSLTVLSVPATYGEAFGLYLIEAMACRVPVAEPDDAGPGEIVRATGGGLLCQKDDPAALAAILGQIVSDPALRERLAKDGCEAARRGFSSDRMAEDFAAVCAGVLAAKN